jgi:RNA polymerase sigma factor (sigma-70 family)
MKPMVDDSELLRDYVKSGSETAMAEFVRRHLSVVYFAALRRTSGDTALAQDIAQQVFIAAARQAGALARHSSLTGWLYTTTRYTAAKAFRAEQTRRRHEQTATMHELTSAEPALEWERLRPVIDDALDTLDERDREVILIRRPFADIGATLRISQDAARMRVDRAVEKLRLTLERRGIKSISAALATVLATQSGLAVPASMIATVSGAAAAAGVGSASAAATLLGFMSATKITWGAASLVAVLATTFLFIERNRAAEAEGRVASVSAERAALRAQLVSAQTRLRKAESRAAEAEKDTGKLLEALENARAKQSTAQGPPADAVPYSREAGAEAEAMLEEHRLNYRKFNANDAKQKAQMAEQVRSLDPASAFNLKMTAVQAYVDAGKFKVARSRFNEAMAERPADLPLTDHAKQLQATIEEQSVPVELKISSDGQTILAFIDEPDMRVLAPLKSQSLKLQPGNYEIIGRRKGFQDVSFTLQVRNGLPPPAISVSCTIPVSP